jgi:hypothetical protein
MLAGDGHTGQTYDLTGSEAVTSANAAGVMSRDCGTLCPQSDNP